ncbi:MAG: MFS transporter, partial [Thermoleophilia bacterium]|nr:MFS transporter [Thermoleophilia bacterium]
WPLLSDHGQGRELPVRHLAGVRRRGDSPFRHRDFALFWTAMLLEGFALTMATVAIGWQVYAVRGNPLDLGLVGLAEFVPLLVLALPAGQLADRVPRRRVIAVTILLDVAVLSVLLALTTQGIARVWPFFALAFVTGIGAALRAPAGRALTPSLVPQELLVSALAHRSIAFQLSAVLGPAVGGVLFALRAELVYGAAATLSLGGLVCVLGLRAGREPATEGTITLDDLLAGVRLIRRTNVLLGAISLDLFAVLLGGAVALLPVFAKDILEVGPTGLGLLRTAPALGAFAAALLIARFPIRRRAGPTLFVVVAAFGACMVVFGLSRELWLSLLALALGGAFDMVSVVLRSTILPLVTPDALRGRVTAVEMVFISASNELGAFESGVVAALLGAVPAVVLGGLATIAIAGLWWRLFPALARVDRLDELRPVPA